MLSILSSKIKYEPHISSDVLCRIGDKGTKFYIILKGSIKVYVITCIRVKLTEQDYVRHLLKLKYYKERELYNRTFSSPHNQRAFPMNDFHIDDKELTDCKRHAVKKKHSTFHHTDKISLSLEYKLDILNQIKQADETIKEYIQKIQIDQSKLSQSNGTELEIFQYIMVNKMFTGDKFGDIALEDDDSKR